MTADLAEQLARWAGAPVAAMTTEPLDGGAVAARVDLLTVRCTDGAVHRLVRKTALPHEVRALRAVQHLRDNVIPELVAAGTGDGGPWLVTPFHPGAPLPAPPAPQALFTTLARLHARFRHRPVPGVPVVDPAWWRRLIHTWVLPQVRPGHHPPEVIDRAVGLLHTAAGHAAYLDGLPGTLLHGDVHPGNILVHTGVPHLIDWGSARFGPPAIDPAAVTTPGSAELRIYTETWHRQTGTEPDLDPGWRWARLQIPVQYLPRSLGNRATPDVIAVLDRIEAAVNHLPIAG